MWFTIAHGNPFDGISLVGTWDNSFDANEWASKNLKGDWWIIGIADPEADYIT
jgi:hypothetical protein